MLSILEMSKGRLRRFFVGVSPCPSLSAFHHEVTKNTKVDESYLIFVSSVIFVSS